MRTVSSVYSLINIKIWMILITLIVFHKYQNVLHYFSIFFFVTMWVLSLSPSSERQITVFHIGSEDHQDIDVAILRALLKGVCDG